MPLLDAEHVQNLLEAAHMHGKCRECGHSTAMDYCRTCDEFYWIHRCGCMMFTDEHDGHRLTIVPFIENRWPGDSESDDMSAPDMSDAEISHMIVALAKESARRSFQEAVNTLIGGGIEDHVARMACRAALTELVKDLIQEDLDGDYERLT